MTKRGINCGAALNVPCWYVYIISNRSHTTYVGETVNLPRRIYEHKTGYFRSSFTAKYTFDRCVYYEVLPTQNEAIRREQQIKSWSRAKKVALIQAKNPYWRDLSLTWTEALTIQ